MNAGEAYLLYKCRMCGKTFRHSSRSSVGNMRFHFTMLTSGKKIPDSGFGTPPELIEPHFNCSDTVQGVADLVGLEVIRDDET